MKHLLFLTLLLASLSFAHAQTYPPLEIQADAVFTPAGGVVDVPIRAGNNWQNITQIAGTIEFDTTIIGYNSMVFWGLSNPAGASFTYMGNGLLSFSWTSLITIGPTLSNGDIVFTLRFNVVGNPGDTSPVEFTNSATALYWYNGFGWSGNNYSITNGAVNIICGQPTANFGAVDSMFTVNFTDSSSASGGATYLWNFGDGNTSTSANPTHTYSTGGTYTVCLIVTDSCSADTSCQQVNVCLPPGTAFSNTASELNLSFTDATTNTPTSWLWDFGDGNTSTAQNPTHTYAVPGNYTVCLTTVNTCGVDSSCSVIAVTCSAPTPQFSETASGLSVAFTDNSTNSPTSWLWDFGDGSTSTVQNPTHTYANGGTYTVCLTVTSLCGSDSSCQSVVAICPLPGAAFSDSSSNLAHFFTDQTSNSPASWFWDFGDGNTSSNQNPFHSYAAPGTYTVCLIVSNSCGADTSCSPVTVTCPAPVAAFTQVSSGLTFQFTDVSTQTPTSWAWDFGDGNTSSMQNPSHTYAAAGSFQVCLIATSMCGADTVCDSVSINTVGMAAAHENGWQLFPNPATDRVSIRSDVLIQEIEIVGISGRVLKVWENVNQRETRISVENMPSGLLFIRLRTEKGWQQKILFKVE